MARKPYEPTPEAIARGLAMGETSPEAARNFWAVVARNNASSRASEPSSPQAAAGER